MNIPIKLLKPNAKLPKRATEFAAGYDVYACLEADIWLHPGERKMIPSGVAFALPDGMVAYVCPRSGLALKNGISVLNAPGIIDPDYTGEIEVVLQNHGEDRFQVKNGDRIAQIVFNLVAFPKWKHVTELPTTERGTQGFGSSGI